jgi:2-polyprenyl-3-methyl-5-hydroxy-6-metoxy-1,4-benzoquinol methylase
MTNYQLEERTAIRGFHDHLISQILPEFATGRKRALDLGAGSGALAVRLRDFGLDVLAVDIDGDAFRARVPFVTFVRLDLNEPGFARSLLTGEGFDLITAVEVIEHLESPVGFLRNVRWLLNPGGAAVVTTPNVDNLPARAKFLLRGRLRGLDEQSEKTHITPVFWDLLTRQWLPRAALSLVAYHRFPPGSYALSRPRYALPFWALAKVFGGECLLGDTHVFILQRRD